MTETFIAESAVDAVAQIRAKLGPDAVVVDVRKRAANQIEVVAEVPLPAPAKPAALPASNEHETTGASSRWRVGPVLESLGLLPLYAARVVQELEREHGAVPPAALATQLTCAESVLERLWRPAVAPRNEGLHVFVGAPGVGKTTCLCKWLSRAVLLEGRSARVWRLDGQTANTAEWLNVHGEILGVPVERSWPGSGRDGELGLVDLPGIGVADQAARAQLQQWLAELPGAQAHLVVNGAYEMRVLQDQVAAWRECALAGVIVTHLDEEPRGGKLWNLALGTDCSLEFLAAGQNVPGEFVAASAAALLAKMFPTRRHELAQPVPQTPAAAGAGKAFA